jgi:excisionase family DNA binding protein
VIEKASDGLTAAEVARRLGVDPATVRNWIRLGKLPAVSFGPDGTVVRVDPAELDKLRQPVIPKTKRPVAEVESDPP